MSFKNLGIKQTIVLHNCEIDNQKYDLVIVFLVVYCNRIFGCKGIQNVSNCIHKQLNTFEQNDKQ